MISLSALYGAKVGDTLACPDGMLGNLLPVAAEVRIGEVANRGERRTVGGSLMVHGIKVMAFDVDLSMVEGEVKMVTLGVAR